MKFIQDNKTGVLKPARLQRGFINPGPSLFYKKQGGGSGDAHWSDRVSLLYFEGPNNSTTITDEVIASTWTAHGNANITTADHKFGSSCLILDGSGDYLLSGYAASFWKFLHDGTTPWTFEGFLNPAGSGSRTVFDTGGAATLSSGVWLGVYTTGQLTYRISRNTSGSYGGQVDGGSTPNGSWTYVKAIFDPAASNGKQMKLFCAGSQVNEGTLTSPSALDPNSTMNIGQYQANGLYYNGKMDMFRITKGFADYSTGVPSQQFPNHG